LHTVRDVGTALPMKWKQTKSNKMLPQWMNVENSSSRDLRKRHPMLLR